MRNLMINRNKILSYPQMQRIVAYLFISKYLKSMTDQLGNQETYEYDYNDNLTSISDRKGQKTEYTYDYLDRITKASKER